MQTQTQTPDTAQAKKRRTKLPADAGGAIQMDVIRKSVDELVVLYERKQTAAEAFKDSVDAIATKGGVSKKALKAYITAKAKEELPKAHAAASQLVLLFEEL